MDQEQREQLRSQHKLRPLTKEEEGTSIFRLPDGVFGFSYAPATETPAFARKSYHSFEVHRRQDGTLHVIAFATPAEAARIAGHEGEIDVTVYPDPYQEATTMVIIAFERVLNNLYKPIRYDGNALPLKLAAA